MNEAALDSNARWPWLIQGGMGISISDWRLARVVARAGQLGVVSGTAIDAVFVRRLQKYGMDERLHAVLARFPVPAIVDDVLRQFNTARRRATGAYRSPTMLTHESTQRSVDLLVLAAFAEVAMAKSGHAGLVGINLLTKVQLPTVALLCGAMIAGVDFVLMGAGVPTHIPGILERLRQGLNVCTPLEMTNATPKEAPVVHFDPTTYLDGAPRLTRPRFLGIISSNVLASALLKRSDGPVDGFVVERPVAGGHNAPPRGPLELDEDEAPIYGPRDEVNYASLAALGRPFWIAGGITSPAHVRAALNVGATGVQVGTLFAYCDESGMDPALRQRVLAAVTKGPVDVRTSVRASSTGYPFKVVSVAGSIGDPSVYAQRTRRCDLGYLREAFLASDGTIGYRCAAEPVEAYVRKGGDESRTVDATCLCNGLMAACGLGQIRANGDVEPPIITSGDCLNEIRSLADGRAHYRAIDVIKHLRTGLDPGAVASQSGNSHTGEPSPRTQNARTPQ